VACLVLAAMMAAPTEAFAPSGMSAFSKTPSLRAQFTNAKGAPVPTLRLPKVASSVPSVSSLRMAISDEAQISTSGGAGGYFTGSNPEDRRIQPENTNGRKKFKVVYVVLESQYQSSMTIASKRINAGQDNVCVESVGYLLEELRNPDVLAAFKKDVESANMFIGSLIFVQELAEKVVEVVQPMREKLDAVLIFPSMPDVMRLNKVGTFTMAQMGQSKSVIGEFMKKKRQDNGASFEGSMLKLLRTLPKVLKYLPSDKAQDARSFMMSFQYWLGGSPENLEALLLMMAQEYIYQGEEMVKEEIMAPVLLPDLGIWHPLAHRVFENAEEYNTWYDTEHAELIGIDAKSAPTVGVILQKSHINTNDESHYTSLIQEIEARGARVMCVYTGTLDFSVPVEQFFTQSSVVPDSVINLTGFALVGGPASQDHDKAVEVLSKLNRPYICAVPLVFQSFEEWKSSELGLHPIQVALQVSLPEIDGAIEPIIYGGRDGMTGRTVPLPDRINLVADRALKWANLRMKQNKDKKLAISIFSFPPDKGNVGTAAYLDVFGSISAVGRELKRQGYDLAGFPTDPEALMDSVLNDKEARVGSPYLNVEYKMNMKEYAELTPYAGELEENWGKPPGQLNSDGQNLLVYGKRFGNVFIGVQPSFGYEGDPMRLLFSKSASPHHGFAAYHTYLERVFQADAVLHFGTHGSLEFMPGKQVGMSGSCYPDRLINSMPNLYYYAANNPSEATIAKRRSYAATISYLTPPPRTPAFTRVSRTSASSSRRTRVSVRTAPVAPRSSTRSLPRPAPATSTRTLRISPPRRRTPRSLTSTAATPLSAPSTAASWRSSPASSPAASTRSASPPPRRSRSPPSSTSPRSTVPRTTSAPSPASSPSRSAATSRRSTAATTTASSTTLSSTRRSPRPPAWPSAPSSSAPPTLPAVSRPSTPCLLSWRA